uniref:Antibiotic biosynthesis monooxygenase family protein n=1 Tax=Chryseobacterium endophyticum TaxID=1854762 RepID=A0AAU6WRB8_9FLAO
MDIFVKTITETMENKYLLYGKLTAKPGQQKELVDILMQASQLVSTAKGCQLYAVSYDKEDEASVYVTETWNSI